MDPVVPRNSIPSMAAKMQALKVDDKSEKGLLVRIGTLIDAIVQAQRGATNAPGSVPRQANITNLQKPKPLDGSTENIFNGASVSITPTSSSLNLSHYQAQIDSDPNFSNPTVKDVFTTGTTFKGLDAATTYSIRIRPITKTGQVGDWALLNSIITTGPQVAADFDGDSLGSVVLSKTFTFDSSTQDIFCASAVGLRDIVQTAEDMSGNTVSIDASLTEVDLVDRRIGSSTDAIEGITLAGHAPTSNANPDTSILTMEVRRYNPLIFFNLMQAKTGVLFPVNYTFDVQISVSGGAFASSTEDTVWVQF